MSAKKPTAAEKVLERTAEKFEAVAAEIKTEDAKKKAKQDPDTAEKLREMGLDPNAAGAEGNSVICPDCGQLIPCEFDSFISQKSADQYAMEHCDCHKRLMEQIAIAVRLPEPDCRLRVPTPPGPPKYGTCRFCGQSQTVAGCMNEEQAEEVATRLCRCAKAMSYREELSKEQRREEALEAAGENIDELFGSGAASRDEEVICANALESIKTGAQLVYDSQIVSWQSALTYSTKAKISMNSKGVLSIERKNTSTSKMEV